MSNKENGDKEHGNKEHDQVTIIIDKKEYKSPNPTTGSALYALAHVPADHDLFLEVHGHGDDTLIQNTAAPVRLKDGSHLYTAQRTLNPGSSHVAA